MKYTKTLKYITLALIAISLSACSAQKRIKKADQRYEIGEYNKAATMYYKSIRGVKNRYERANATYKMAECYRLIGNNSRAASSYKNAIKYKFNDPIVYLNYANVLYEENKLAEAKKYYKLYLNEDPTNSQALNGVLACDSIAKWNLKTRYKVALAKQFEERRSSSFCPAIIGDNNETVYFTTNRDGVIGGKEMSAITGQRNNDIFVTSKNRKNEWSEPEAAPSINSEFDEGTPAFSSNGKTMFFTRALSDDSKKNGVAILSAKRKGSEWSEPEILTILQDSLADTLIFAHPAPNESGTKLIFASNIPGGFGGTDLWMVKQFGEVWSEPTNLGTDINTSGNEVFPYLRDDTTLYYSSDGLPGFGGLDIYRAVQKNDTTWLTANMGTPINSKNDDFGITFSKENEQGFFSSNRGDRKGFDHIYSFVLPILEFKFQGKITDNKTNDPIAGATIRLIGNDGTNMKISTKKDGTYSYPLSKEVEYVFLATARGYLNQSGEMNTLNAEQSIVHNHNFKLASIRQPIRLNNIFFDFASSELTPESHTSLDTLVQTLNDNPNITIEISAHSDAIGENDVNLELSEQRAQSVVNYVISKGIKADRLTAVGYGEDKPAVVEEIYSEKYKFLAVGDTLNETFVKELNEKEREIAYSINRRTEFKVLSTTYKAK